MIAQTTTGAAVAPPLLTNRCLAAAEKSCWEVLTSEGLRRTRERPARVRSSSAQHQVNGRGRASLAMRRCLGPARRYRWVVVFILVLACSPYQSSESSLSPPPPTPAPGPFTLIPSDRLTTWSPGIPGGIPARTTVCANLSAGTYGNGSGDATNGIQAALDACPVGQVVQLSSGDFKITHFLQITKGIVLRGAGPTQTKLKMPVGTNSNLITVGTQWFKFTQATNLASTASKGSRSVNLANNPGLTVGEIVLVDQLTDSSVTEWSSKSPPGDVSRTWFTRPNRPIGQVMEVQSVSGTTITFTTPFHIAFQTALAAQLTRFSNVDNGPVVPSVKYAGVEDLYLYGGSGGQGNITLSNAAYSWIKNIESDFQDGPSVAIDASFRSIVRDSYIHSTQQPYPGGGGYGISFSWYSADNLVENNIVWNMNKVMVMRASGGGNVVGYNYMEDGRIGNNEERRVGEG